MNDQGEAPTRIRRRPLQHLEALMEWMPTNAAGIIAAWVRCDLAL
jgi:hypothetical protein